jgi:hypothetical protein
MPITRAVPHPAAPATPRTRLSTNDRLGPVIDSPQRQPAGAPNSHARTPTPPKARPVTGHAHAVSRVGGARLARPYAMSATAGTISAQRDRARPVSTEGGHPVAMLESR